MMSQRVAMIAVCFGFSLSLSLRADDADYDAKLYWPQWRGPLGTGVAPQSDPPVVWDEETNIRWKIKLPGSGHATPIVWRDRIFVTTAVPYGEKLPPRYSGAPGAHDNLPVTQRHRFFVLAIDRGDGRIVWEKAVHDELPHEGGHETASLASNSPVTDGEHLFAYFGSRGLYCLNFEGDVVWEKDMGRMHSKHGHGEGSSPVLYGDQLIINWDHEGESFLISLNKKTGEPQWKVKRDEVTSWATPIVVEHGGRAQVVVSGTDRVRGYDLTDGTVIWECGGLSANIVATPVAGDGMIFAASSYEKQALLAIRLEGAHGDITGTDQLVWSRRRLTPYVPSPLLYDGALYFLRHYQGILSRLDAKSGEDAPGAFRLAGIRNVYASPVGASGRVCITDLDGMTMVISNEDRPRLLARNQLDDRFSASAAIVGGEIILRGHQSLYRIAEESKPKER